MILSFLLLYYSQLLAFYMINSIVKLLEFNYNSII